MVLRSLSTQKYDLDIKKILETMLDGEHFKIKQRKAEGFAFYDVRYHEKHEDEFVTAVSLLMLRALQQSEITALVNKRYRVFSEKERRNIMLCALKSSRAIEQVAPVKRLVAEHFATDNQLILEGFMRFRLRDVLDVWQRSADRAAEELLLHREYLEFLHLLKYLAGLQPVHAGEVQLHLLGDGGYTLCDAQGLPLNQGDCDGLVGLLIGLSPEKILIFKSKSAVDTQVIETIGRVFEGRVRILP